MTDNRQYQLNDDDRQLEMTDQWGMADNGELYIMEMTDNADERQLEIIDNGA